MHSRKIVLVSVCLVLAAAMWAVPAAAQQEEGTIGMVVRIKVKQGMEQQYEEAVKKHNEWHRQQNDPWAWYSWQIISGKKTGQYGAGTFGHRWEDFDTAPVSREADAADAQKTLGPYEEKVVVTYWSRLSELSRPRPEGMGPAPVSVVEEFKVRLGAEDKFLHAIKKVHKAIEKTNWDAHYEWYMLVNGGSHPTFALVLPQENWADMAPPEKPFDKMLKEGLGETEAEMVEHLFDHVIKQVKSWLTQNRPDLSYMPEQAEE